MSLLTTRSGIFVALVIAQTCKRNVVSPIQLPAFSQALQKLAPVARALNGIKLFMHFGYSMHECLNKTIASVHLPRMGLRGSDWYAAERAIRRYLVSHGVPTHVYVPRDSTVIILPNEWKQVLFQTRWQTQTTTDETVGRITASTISSDSFHLGVTGSSDTTTNSSFPITSFGNRSASVWCTANITSPHLISPRR